MQFAESLDLLFFLLSNAGCFLSFLFLAARLILVVLNNSIFKVLFLLLGVFFPGDGILVGDLDLLDHLLYSLLLALLGQDVLLTLLLNVGQQLLSLLLTHFLLLDSFLLPL